MRAAVTWFDGGDWRDGVIAVSATEVRLLAHAPTSGLPRLDGVITGGFTDHHVHIQLIDPALLAESMLGRVNDLGGNPAVLSDVHNSSRIARTPADSDESAPYLTELEELRTIHGVEFAFAGAFLTPPGGYPSDRSWAPEGSVREIANADDAERAIVEMKDAGAVRIKIASNSNAGPVFTDELLRTIISIAASHRLPIVAHAEGRGEAQRVVRLGAGRLAHAPFSELLSDSETAAQAASASWISTLAVHHGAGYDTAVENVRRFHAAGGTVLYGTDMGNGPTPVGLNSREIRALREAGIVGVDLLQCLDPTDPRDPQSRLLFFPGQSPETADPLRARLLAADDLRV
ncbi:amidohydrolase [Microbacterium sp. CH12i]|uniref:hypothetical protein n=1 Tax=Microbacterium sp. CH12i TaxID=1479651 RepID=UPI000461417C|nr:hypothetical protein [Microbacterium sp. CH12i]KDA06985.1 amidohydrolase [Microbacterium sp. CH12i]